MTTKGQTYDGKVVLLFLGCIYLFAFSVLQSAISFCQSHIGWIPRTSLSKVDV